MDRATQLNKIEALMRRKTTAAAAAPVKAAESVIAAEPVIAAPAVAAASTDIAIIGLSGQFPGCDQLEDFWAALENQHSLISALPTSRFDWHSLPEDYQAMAAHQAPQWAGLLKDIDGFDAAFFAIEDHQAQYMDPRQRLLMMSVYHTLEDAGYAPDSLRQSQTGLFIGVEDSEFAQQLQQAGVEAGLENAPSMIANRIAYQFDFLGCSEFVNSLCASGAVALHRAVNALRLGEISQAVVGAANVMLQPEPFIGLAAMGQMCSSDTVASFGATADGYLRADGVASVLLKPLAQAEHDGDGIYAVIKNTAVNFNGQGGLSFATPNIAAHMAVVKQCYQGVDPRQISYIEAQGMGTPVSDMAEWNAFNRALQAVAQDQRVALTEGYCRISTVKPMLGHMHSASAFGALFKVIHSLRSEQVYGIHGFTEASNDLDMEQQPCRLLTQPEAWPKHDQPRLAGIHSYGLGGNNAHLLIGEYQVPKPINAVEKAAEGSQILLLSGASPDVCRQQINALWQHLRLHPDHRLLDLAHTLQQGRDGLAYRVAFVADSVEHWLTQARSVIDGVRPEGMYTPDMDPAISSDITSNWQVKLAQQWVGGAKVVWPILNGQRLHLPGYRFERKSFALDIAVKTVAKTAAKTAVSQLKTAPRYREIDQDPSLSTVQKLQRYVKGVLAQLLHLDIEAIDSDSPFIALGMDSLIGVRLLQGIEGELGIKLSGRQLLECDTTKLLCELVHNQMLPPPEPPPQTVEVKSDADKIALLNQFKSGQLTMDEIKNAIKG